MKNLSRVFKQRDGMIRFAFLQITPATVGENSLESVRGNVGRSGGGEKHDDAEDSHLSHWVDDRAIH